MGRTAGMAGIVLGIMTVIWTFGSVASGRLMVYVTYRADGLRRRGVHHRRRADPADPVAARQRRPCRVGCITGRRRAGLLQHHLGRFRADTGVLRATRLGHFGDPVHAVPRPGDRRRGRRHHPDRRACAINCRMSVDPLGRLLSAAGSDATTDPNTQQLARAVAVCFRGIFAMAALLGLVTLALGFQLPRGIGAGSQSRRDR